MRSYKSQAQWKEQECGKTCGFQGFTNHARNPPLGRCSLYCFCSSSAPTLPTLGIFVWISSSGVLPKGGSSLFFAVWSSWESHWEATQKAQSQTAGNTCQGNVSDSTDTAEHYLGDRVHGARGGAGSCKLWPQLCLQARVGNGSLAWRAPEAGARLRSLPHPPWAKICCCPMWNISRSWLPERMLGSRLASAIPLPVPTRLAVAVVQLDQGPYKHLRTDLFTVRKSTGFASRDFGQPNGREQQRKTEVSGTLSTVW